VLCGTGVFVMISPAAANPSAYAFAGAATLYALTFCAGVLLGFASGRRP